MDQPALPPVVQAAARGELPSWAQPSPSRRRHMARVAELMREWAASLQLEENDRIRWEAVAWLHDGFREAPPEQLREMVPPELRDLPGPLLHGPAAAARLAGEADEGVLDAIRYHTMGHPRLDQLGRALYLADFLEPGRDFEVHWREQLRRRMPHQMDEVLAEVLQARIRHLLEVRKPIRPETAGFWSQVVSQR